MNLPPTRTLFLSIALASCISFGQRGQSEDAVNFSLEVRPILSEHCFHCHGPDESHRQADLRLDQESSARDSTHRTPAVVPGDRSKSELWNRIVSNDAELVMPPPSTHRTLTDAQRETIGRWIDAGAPWGEHWSFVAPTIRPLPSIDNPAWGKSPIDAWVYRKLKDKSLEPAPMADSYTLCRRLHLDLIGLPPTMERSQAFAREHALLGDSAIDRLIDELLHRKEYGEHWARVWLDLGRYADTKGYEKDLGRDMWPYRDWVIQALNHDMPLDQFTIEQLAGDLLPHPTEQQRIATAFHRATLANDEGGTDDEEFRVAAVKDRVDTTLQVWMGLTVGCAKCHSHKYDPLSIEEYYQLFAVFNQTEDADRYDDEPKLPLANFEQQQKLIAVDAQRKQIELQLREQRALDAVEQNKAWRFMIPKEVKSENGSEFVIQPDHSVLAKGTRPDRDVYSLELELPVGNYRSLRLEALTAKINSSDPSEAVGRNPADPNFVLSELSLSVIHSDGSIKALDLGGPKADTEQPGWPIVNATDGKPETGWAIGDKKHQPHWAQWHLSQPLTVDTPQRIRISLSQQFGGGLLLHRVRWSVSEQEMESLIPKDSPESAALAKSMSDVDKQLQQIRDSIPKLPIMRELAATQHRTTKVHIRGSFLDPGDVVQASLPKAFSTPAQAAAKVDRLRFAQWLVSPENPLTARVMVNRTWSQIFGRGLVETEEDFGSQGSLPSHPELLDWLAIEYRDHLGWSHKQLLKTIVKSSAYQQAYVLDAARKEKDPRNVWLSRAARHRLSAEVVRDNALMIAGLLSGKQGGPPVMPPQPDGLWRSTYSGASWITSKNEDRYRRGIYTYWKRTTPYPSMETFDSSTREVCQIRRITTNTPLQALVTLNDPVYVEASLAFAQRVLRRKDVSDRERMEWALELATCRPTKKGEADRLVRLLNDSRQHFAKDPGAVQKLVDQAQFPRERDISDLDLAAWSVALNIILNLDEVLTKS